MKISDYRKEIMDMTMAIALDCLEIRYFPRLLSVLGGDFNEENF